MCHSKHPPFPWPAKACRADPDSLQGRSPADAQNALSWGCRPTYAMTDRELVRKIERSPGQRAGYKQLVRELGLGGGKERRLLVEQLMRLTARGQLVKVDRDSWSLPKAAATRENLFAGRLDLHRDGFGFVRPEVRQG